MIKNEMNSQKKIIEKIIENLQNYIYTASIITTETIKNGNKIFLFGNGSSSLTCQNIALKMMLQNKKVLSLCSESAIITSIGNNYDFDRIFELQIKTLAQKGDLLIGISTSGNSKNVLRALSLGQNMGCKTIGFSGYDGGAMNEFSDINLTVPSDNKDRIKEMHIMIGNIICQVTKGI